MGWLDLAAKVVTAVRSSNRTASRPAQQRSGHATARPRGRNTDPLPGGDTVVITYAPTRDGDADPGEVVWTWVPYEEDPAQGKDRPVVVIGLADDRLAVVPLSSKDHAGRVPVGSGAWDSSGRPSYANVERVLRVAPKDVRREGSALERRRFDAVVAAVRALHSDVR